MAKDQKKTSRFDFDEHSFSTTPSKVLGRSGIGAIVDMNGTSLLILDSEDWYWDNDRDYFRINEPRLQAALQATGFLRVPTKEDWTSRRVTAMYFTDWYYSPTTKVVKRLYQWRSGLSETEVEKFYNEGPFEKGTGRLTTRLIPMPYFLACKNGHLSEFPYVKWCHAKGGVCANPQLTYQTYDEKPFLRCTNCGETNLLTGNVDIAMLRTIVPKCYGDRPWDKFHTQELCNEEVMPLRKEDSNSYFPNFYSSLKLPYKAVVDTEEWLNSSTFQALSDQYNTETGEKTVVFDALLDGLLKQFPGLSADKVMSEFEGITDGEMMALDEFKLEEYNVLNQIEKLTEEEDNQTEFQQIVFDLSQSDNPLLQAFDTISVLPLITTVKAAVNFTRVSPKSLTEEGTISLRRADGRYIAIQAKGEGIFFSFKKEWIESEIPEYVDRERFVHTMSHLMMKELGEVSGYPITSLSERLYLKDGEMYGVMIYTASGDKNGTLGGVVEQGVMKNFVKNLNHALNHAQWCSFDPVCRSQEEDKASQNKAACHYCCFVPETSCEDFNRKLDRTVVLDHLGNSH